VRFLVIPALLMAALVVAWLDDDAGIRSWMTLRDDVAQAELRLEDLRSEIAVLEAEAAALASEPFAQEKAIREELGWAKPGETVIKLPESAPLRRETP
jgi:cell division protein FtsB